jgi:hypothetical protein
MTDNRIQHPPLPRVDQRAALDLDDLYTRDELETLKKGLQPMAMEDKWAIDYDAPWLYFRRSWTGFCVFAIRLEETGPASGPEPAAQPAARIAESWVSRNEDEYRSQSLDDDRATLRFLLDGFLLNKPVPLPQPPGESKSDLHKQIHQHHVFGRTDD